MITSDQFSNLFMTYRQRFEAIALYYVRDAVVTEDLVMEGFMRLWACRDSIPEDCNIPGYVLTIIKHLCMDWLNAQKKQWEVQQKVRSHYSDVVDEGIRSLSVSDPKELYADEVYRLISCTLETLPVMTREIFIHVRYNGKTYKEVAEAYNITVRRVNFEIQKTIRAMKLSLADYLPATLITLYMKELYL